MEQKQRRALGYLALIGAFAWALQLRADPLPEWRFQVLRSDHFEVIYHDTQKALAKRYILAAEQARELLLPIFKEAPDVTLIYISDDTDQTNGLASFLPYPMITVYPVLPSTLDSIDDSGDWPLELLVHEYTHILNMYPAHGFYVPLKYLFGGVIRPNAILPTWYLEGLAVDMESHLTDHGRLRSDETQANARALALSGNIHRESVSRINEQELVSWPYGSRPYDFGAWWWNTVHEEHGDSIVEKWNQDFARRLPFLLNGPMRSEAGGSAQDLLSHTEDKVTARAEDQLKVLRAGPHIESRPLAKEKGNQVVFAVSPRGGKLIYLNRRKNFGVEARIKERRTTGEDFATVDSRVAFKVAGTTSLRWLDENRVVLDQIDVTSPYVSFSDLYIYDVGKRHMTRLTHRARATQPTPSPNGESLAFIQNDGGRNYLALMPLKAGAASRILVHGNFQQRLSSPTFLNDLEILFVLRSRSGSERLFVYNLSDGKVRPWNTTLDSAQNPRMTSKGVLVSDDQTHVRNIYWLSPAGGAPQAVTNTLTHIECADFDPQRRELIYSELSPSGPELRAQAFQVLKPPAIEGFHMAPPPVAKTTSVKVHDESFQPFSYLYPRYWIPFVYTVENGGWLFQGATSNSDPTGRNSYTAVASIDTITKKPSYGIDYVNRSLPVALEGSYGRYVSYLGTSSYIFQSDTAALNASTYWPFDSKLLSWSVGALETNIKSPFTTYKRMGPNAGFMYDRLQTPTNRYNGFLFEASYQQYVKAAAGDLSYGRSYAHFADLLQLGGGNKIFFQARGALAPQLPFTNVIDLGDRSLGGNYLVNLTNSDFLLRGYPSGEFVGRKILNANLEYSLPLFQLEQGYGTFPLYLRALEVAFITDAMAVDGGGYIPSLGGYYRLKMSDYFMGSGVEFRLNTTAAYHWPVSWIAGAYYGMNPRYGGGFTPFFSFSLGDLSALQNKTP